MDNEDEILDYKITKNRIKFLEDHDYFNDNFTRLVKSHIDDDFVSYCFENSNEKDIVDCFQYMEDDYYTADSQIEKAKIGSDLYRGLKIEPKDFETFKKSIEFNNLGIYWAWDIGSAGVEGEGHNRNQNDVVLIGNNPSDIDVDGTYLTNMDFRCYESEIRLMDNSTIFLKEVCKWNENERHFDCEKYGARVKV